VQISLFNFIFCVLSSSSFPASYSPLSPALEDSLHRNRKNRSPLDCPPFSVLSTVQRLTSSSPTHNPTSGKWKDGPGHSSFPTTLLLFEIVGTQCEFPQSFPPVTKKLASPSTRGTQSSPTPDALRSLSFESPLCSLCEEAVSYAFVQSNRFAPSLRYSQSQAPFDLQCSPTPEIAPYLSFLDGLEFASPTVAR